ncbi:mediator complex, subunit Med21 [Tricharina praecox]|uniref:mediator complex, subunit Med21 n=1 Tax=Tricharina praecox TaxID=43433 RepID=UPI002221029E|nr:mediator complex, subunit Med21 [Tricharina praecox]KAI5850956.1 mediator complex, subunit Med21 [Tricharina praecox]
MADRLTQLQDAVDQIATQFFSAIRYIGTHHDAVPVGNEAKVTDENATIDTPEVFESRMSELARDLIIKSKQIEVLITTLPGIGVSEDDQQARLRSLEAQLKEAEEERVKSVQEKEDARVRLESVVVKLRRV